MKSYIVRLLRASAGAAFLLSIVAGTAHAAYYAKTISSNTVYSLMATGPNGTISSTPFWQGGTNLAGIATHGQYAFVSDNTSTGAVLHVMHLSGQYIGKVSLGNTETGVKSAGAVSVDNAGRVYVADMAPNSNARYAMVYAPNWSYVNSGVSRVYGSVDGNWQIDLAAYSEGAVIVRRNDEINPDGEIGGTGATTINPDGTSSNRGTLVDAPGIPSAVTTNRANGSTYVLTNTTTLNSNFQYDRTATLIGRSTNWEDLGSISFGDTLAHDLAFVSSDYIGMVGVANGALQAWRIGLDNDGSLLSTYSVLRIADDQSATHKVAASSDGRMLWVTSQATGMVYGLDYGNWSSTMGSLSVGDYIKEIAVHDYVVPEPSSIVSFLAFGAGTFGFWRRRRQA